MQISNFQIFCTLLHLTTAMAFVITPAILYDLVANNSWLAMLTAIIPTLSLAGIFTYILKKSTRPFPQMLEDCFGITAGKILSFTYIPVFFISTSLTLYVFVNFVESSVLPGLPISVLIGAMLLAGFYAIRMGLESICRVLELGTYAGLIFVILMFILTITTVKITPGNLLPVSYISTKNFSSAVFQGFYITGNMLVVLLLAFHSTAREKIPQTLLKFSFTYITILTVICGITTITLGNTITFLPHPTFKMIRLVRLGDFIQNIDALFIAIWILGLFGAVTFMWFMTCYTTQQALHLKDFRFLAAPSSVIIGVISLMIASNIIELETIYIKAFPVLYGIFYILIPLIMFLILLFRPDTAKEISSGLKTPNNQNN